MGFEEVGKYSGHFAAVAEVDNLDIPEPRKTDFANIFFLLSTTTGSQFVMPLIHYRERFRDHGLFEFLIKLDNVVSMAWLLGRRTLKQRLFLMIRKMDEIARSGGSLQERATKFLQDDVLRFDLRYQMSRTQMGLDEFREMLSSEPWGAYGGTRLNKSRYLLLKLDLLHGNPQTRLAFNRATSSVEHIMPRTPQTPMDAPTEEWHSEWVHRLGNLVLLDRKKNSALSNADYSEKRERYQGAFESRPYTSSVFLRYGEWSRAYLENQHEYVVGLLMEYYAGNSSSALDAARKSRQRRVEDLQQPESEQLFSLSHPET